MKTKIEFKIKEIETLIPTNKLHINNLLVEYFILHDRDRIFLQDTISIELLNGCASPGNTNLYNTSKNSNLIFSLKNRLEKEIHNIYNYSKNNDKVKREIDHLIDDIINNIENRIDKYGLNGSTYLYIYNQLYPTIINSYNKISFFNKTIEYNKKQIPNLFEIDMFYNINKIITGFGDDRHTLYLVKSDFKDFYIKLKWYDKLFYFFYKNFNLTNVLAFATIIGTIVGSICAILSIK